MPIYEYECTKCMHTLEALQKISDEPLLQCPACDKPELRKLVSAASFRLTGSGWYETDFKTGAKKQLADADSSGSDSEKSDGDDKSKSTDKTKEVDKKTSDKPTKESTTKMAAKTAENSK